MEIVRLPVGTQAAVDADCIRLEEQPDGRYKLTASALCTDADEGESVSIIDAPLYPTAEDAEVAGLAWATSVGVERLFVSTGTLAQPLQMIEIDKPLSAPAGEG
jgi:hypothetical protein